MTWQLGPNLPVLRNELLQLWELSDEVNFNYAKTKCYKRYRLHGYLLGGHKQHSDCGGMWISCRKRSNTPPQVFCCCEKDETSTKRSTRAKRLKQTGSGGLVQSNEPAGVTTWTFRRFVHRALQSDSLSLLHQETERHLAGNVLDCCCPSKE